MAYDIGEMQAAIWRTEEALQAQRESAAGETDPFMAELANRSLASLEDLLALQQRTLNVLLQQTTLPRHNEIDTQRVGLRYSRPLGGAASASFLFEHALERAGLDPEAGPAFTERQVAAP